MTVEGRKDLTGYIEKKLSRFQNTIKAILGIRNQSLVHNERALSQEKVYEVNGVTPNQICELIDVTCKTINHIASELGIDNAIFDSDRAERATLEMLEVLERGSKVPK